MEVIIVVLNQKMFMQSADEASLSYWDVDDGGNVSQITITGASIYQSVKILIGILRRRSLVLAMTFSSAQATKRTLETGDGSEEIYAGAGGDIIVVQGDFFICITKLLSMQLKPSQSAFKMVFITVDGTPQPI